METNLVHLLILSILASTHLCNAVQRNDFNSLIRHDRNSRGVECNGYSSETLGAVMSPNYPSPYDDYASCSYSIEVPSGYTIQLMFSSFQLESSYDYLYIYDGQDEYTYFDMVSYTGSNLPGDFFSTSNHLYLVFSSDGSVSKNGFYAMYVAYDDGGLMEHQEVGTNVEVCAGSRIISSAGGTVRSQAEEVDSYLDENPEDCEVTFISQDGFTDMTLTFTEFHTYKDNSDPYCWSSESDVVEVTDGDGGVTQLCGDEPYMTYVLPLPVRIRLNFTSIRQSLVGQSYTGFEGMFGLSYDSNGNDDCGMGLFECDESTCMSSDLKCDGVPHCVSESDEWDCSSSNTVVIILVSALVPVGLILLLALCCYFCPKKKSPAVTPATGATSTAPPPAATSTPMTTTGARRDIRPSGFTPQKPPAYGNQPLPPAGHLPPLQNQQFSQPTSFANALPPVPHSVPPTTTHAGQVQGPNQMDRPNPYQFEQGVENDPAYPPLPEIAVPAAPPSYDEAVNYNQATQPQL
ncbi:uncharacterized protein [Ptychodera flava]|uniref:uncharacterized protein n=1 Tax=Ptychodera flava TaxID=63121 RepID=UPI00396A4671